MDKRGKTIGLGLIIFICTAVALIFIFTGSFMTLMLQDFKQSQQEDISQSYTEGYQQGLLYTQQSGNIVIVDNQTGELVVNEYTIGEVCGLVNQGVQDG